MRSVSHRSYKRPDELYVTRVVDIGQTFRESSSYFFTMLGKSGPTLMSYGSSSIGRCHHRDASSIRIQQSTRIELFPTTHTRNVSLQSSLLFPSLFTSPRIDWRRCLGGTSVIDSSHPPPSRVYYRQLADPHGAFFRELHNVVVHTVAAASRDVAAAVRLDSVGFYRPQWVFVQVQCAVVANGLSPATQWQRIRGSVRANEGN